MPPAIRDAADPAGPAPRSISSIGLAADGGASPQDASAPGPPDAGPSAPTTLSSPVPPAATRLGSAAPLPLQPPSGSGAGPDVAAGPSGAPPAGRVTPPIDPGSAALERAAGPHIRMRRARVRGPPATPPDAPQLPASSGGVVAASPPSGGAVYALLTALLGLAAGLLGRLLLATRRWRPVVLIAQLERPG